MHAACAIQLTVLWRFTEPPECALRFLYTPPSTRCNTRRPYFVLHHMLSLLLVHASLAQPVLRPARAHGKPRTTWRAPRGMHRRFSWDALNVTKDTECGLTKCYFPSLQGEREGWLVGTRGSGPALRICRNKRPKPQICLHPRAGFLTQWSRAWALAEELRATFGVDHLLRGPPLLATLSHEQATYLNAELQALDHQKHPKWRLIGHPSKVDGAKQWYAAGPHPVQAVRSCSFPECMVLRCSESLADQAVDDFLANVPNKTKLGLGIKQSFPLVEAMVKAHSCLKIDFQVYLRNDGAVLNIDLDRCDDPISKEEKIKLADGQFHMCPKLSYSLFRIRFENELRMSVESRHLTHSRQG